MKTSQHFLLGLLFIAALAILATFTFFLSDFTFFGSRQTLTVYFPDAGGLREGDSALVAGVRRGQVSDVHYHPDAADPKERITVVVSLDEPVTLHAGHAIVIEDATLLGGKNLSIDPGPFGAARVPDDARLFGSVEPNVARAVGDFISRNEEAISEALATIRDLVKGVEEGQGAIGKLFFDPELAADFERFFRDAADSAGHLEKISSELAAGKGTVGRLLTSDEMYEKLDGLAGNLDTLLTEANAAIADVRDSKGLLGALISDGEMRQNAQDLIRDLEDLSERLSRGEGTLGKLLADDGIATKIEEIVDRLSRGEGTIGKFLVEEQFYEDFRQVAADLRDIAATIRDGRGTLGKLVMEEELYTLALKAVGLLTRSLEEYREAAPISTMTSVIFGAF